MIAHGASGVGMWSDVNLIELGENTGWTSAMSVLGVGEVGEGEVTDSSCGMALGCFGAEAKPVWL